MVPRVSNLGLGAQMQDVIHPKLTTTHRIGDREQQEDINNSEGYKVAENGIFFGTGFRV
jgi:hypothetical protein